MRASGTSTREVLRALLTRFRLLVPALLVALPPFVWVRDGTYRASLTTLGRDQGIFQYIAWAVSQGDVDYRDVRDVNGPLTHLVHMVFLALGGRDEHRFRVLDLATTGLTFAIVGACLPGIARAALGFSRRPSASNRRTSPTNSAASMACTRRVIRSSNSAAGRSSRASRTSQSANAPGRR